MPTVNAELLKILACPACKKPVQFRAEPDSTDGTEGWFVCGVCRREYPYREGIPIMLIEEARMPDGHSDERGNPR